MKYTKIFGIIAILLFAVAISGCTAQDKTYSNYGINFTYPGDMNPNATFVFVTSPTADTKYETLGNGKLTLAIEDVPVNSTIKKAFTFDQFKKLAWNFMNNDQDNKTTELSLVDKSKNGTTIYEEIYTTKDPVSGADLKNERVVFLKNYNNMYQIIFQTKAADFESQQETVNKIINSVVIT